MNDGVNVWDVLGLQIEVPGFDISSVKFEPGEHYDVWDGKTKASVRVNWRIAAIRDDSKKDKTGNSLYCVAIDASQHVDKAYYWGGDPSILDQIDPIKTPGDDSIIGHKRRRESVREHELQHLKIHLKWWSKAAARLNQYEECYCKSECADLAEIIINYGGLVYQSRSLIDSALLDFYSYGGGARATERENKRFAENNPKFERALLDFNKLNCYKDGQIQAHE